MREALFGTPLARVCCGVLLFVASSAFVGPWLSPWPLEAVDWDAIDAPPSAAHWFGTDANGRDLLVRTLSGTGVSLVVALAATAVSCFIGIPWGAVAGYLGGGVDQTLMRIVDGLYALPFVLLVILLVALFGRNIYLLFLGLGAVYWLDLARIVRGQTLVARREAYMDAARALGASTPGIVLRHIAPNVLGPALVCATLSVPGVVIAESFISFLGLGVQEPQTSLGVLIADGAREMRSSPWQLLFPAGWLAATLFALNTLGDRLRDALDFAGYWRHFAPSRVKRCDLAPSGRWAVDKRDGKAHCRRPTIRNPMSDSMNKRVEGGNPSADAQADARSQDGLGMASASTVSATRPEPRPPKPPERKPGTPGSSPPKQSGDAPRE